MGVTDRLRERVRAFVLGPGVVDAFAMAEGHDSSQYAPPEYGDYISTSNGVYACATLRARLFAKLPLRIYRVQSNGKRVEVEKGKTYDLLHKVNPFWTFRKLAYMTELDRCLWGSYFWYLERGQSGKMPPAEIWRGRPDKSVVVPDPVLYVMGYIYRPGNGAADIPYLPGEVIWGPLPNPVDEYSGLSPLGAARLAADYASAAQKSNKALFSQGMQLGGIITPRSGATMTEDQAKLIEKLLRERFSGQANAHRWGVFRFDAEPKPLGLSPKDAEYIEGQRLALEDICRAYGVPQDLVGGQRTYENVAAAMRAIWTQTVLPEAELIASDITEQLLPMLGEADVAEFATDEIEELAEDSTARWTRVQGQITAGAMTLNEWRSEEGLEPVEWGDVWWAPSSLTPVENADKPEPPPAPVMAVPEPENEDSVESPEKPVAGATDAAQQNEGDNTARAFRSVTPMVYGGPAHLAHWQRATGRMDAEELKFYAMLEELNRRLNTSVMARLRKRTVADAAANPFDLPEWQRKFREAARIAYKAIVNTLGREALLDLGLSGDNFSVSNPLVVRFIEARAQRFAQEVTQTSWDSLKASLVQGLDSGDEMVAFEERVRAHFAQYVGDPESAAKAWRSEMIARTEVNGALNGGTLEAWRQTDVVGGKQWIAALDARTRETHVTAHGQTVGIDEDFTVGDGAGPGPGMIGLAEEDIQCRCTMIAVLKE